MSSTPSCHTFDSQLWFSQLPFRGPLLCCHTPMLLAVASFLLSNEVPPSFLPLSFLPSLPSFLSFPSFPACFGGAVTFRNICSQIANCPPAITCSQHWTPSANYFPRARWCCHKTLAFHVHMHTYVHKVQRGKWADLPCQSPGIRNQDPHQLIGNYFV